MKYHEGLLRMEFDLSHVKNYHVVCGYTDMRLGVDKLIQVVMHTHHMVFDDESLFLFCGRRADRFKALYWDGYDFTLFYKRLSAGKLRWPRTSGEVKTMDEATFQATVIRCSPDSQSLYSKSPQVDLF